MHDRCSGSMMWVAIAAAAVSAVIPVSITRTSAQSSTASSTAPAAALKTLWGEPDLQGIWTDETDTPLPRAAKYADQEIFTDAQRAELDVQRASLGGKDNRAERGTELDVTGSYNDLFISRKRTGSRTSRIVDPPNGRIPPLTPEAQKIAVADREFRLALMQATETCKIKYRTCAGGKYDPTPSPQRAELAPRYNTTARMNRHDGPEDATLAERCLTGGLPGIGGNSFRRIVQTPSGISMFYDVGQGQGWQRNIVMDGSPHLPATIRQWYGDSRGHWEGNTLVVETTNFTDKTNWYGSTAGLRLVERFTLADAKTLKYEFTVTDPATWTKPWTMEAPLPRIEPPLYEFACHEQNYGLINVVKGAQIRAAEGIGLSGRAPDYTAGDGK